MARTLFNNGTLQQQHVQQHVAQLAAQAAGNQLNDSAGLSQQQLLRVYSSLIGRFLFDLIRPYLNEFNFDIKVDQFIKTHQN